MRILQHEVEANALIETTCDAAEASAAPADGGDGGGGKGKGKGGGEGAAELTLEVKGGGAEVMSEEDAQALTQETLSHLHVALETIIMFLKDDKKPIPRQVPYPAIVAPYHHTTIPWHHRTKYTIQK